jgi:hypothetical protein
MAETAPLTRRDLEERIVILAWKDDGFRKKFLADPKKEFEEKLGTRLPAALKMTAHQEDENHLHFVIPAKPGIKMDELSDADLEKVAGGVDLIVTATVIGISAVLSAAGSAAAAVTHDKSPIPAPKW